MDQSAECVPTPAGMVGRVKVQLEQKLVCLFCKEGAGLAQTHTPE